MKISIIFGNPPYNEIKQGNRNLPLYHLFMDAAEYLAPRNILVTPARFLFDAGKTPKTWNHKKLEDPHFRVLQYETDSTVFFSNTEINGGVVITEWDKNTVFEPIKKFYAYPMVEKIVNKVFSSPCDKTIYTICSSTPRAYITGKEKTVVIDSDFFIKGFSFVSESQRNSSDIKIYGIKQLRRTLRWIPAENMVDPEKLSGYKVLVPKACGKGGLTNPIVGNYIIAKPGEGYTKTFIAINTKTEEEAHNLSKYIYTRFVAVLLSSVKITQNSTSKTWDVVPLQDFTNQSDIDWSKTIPEIDQQLYAKYGLSKDEIGFIEEKIAYNKKFLENVATL